MGTTVPSRTSRRYTEASETWTDSLDRIGTRAHTLHLCRQWAQMVLVGLCVRLAVSAFFLHDFLDPARDHWEFGFEIGHIARSLATGRGFSDPYWGSTGPTAILTPVYPMLMAAIFRVFGIYTSSSPIAMLLFNCLASAATAIPVFLIARKTFDLQTAKVAAWIWAFFPYAINLSATTMWYHSFVALLLACLVLLALHLQASSSLRAWFGLGVLFGFATLTNPVILSIVPPVGIWLCLRLKRNGKQFIRPALVGVLAMIVTILPWPMRNRSVLHTQFTLKDGFWLEVCVGNVNQTLHWWDGSEHPSGSAAEAAQFQSMGELAYMAAKHEKATAYIHAHPLQYAWRVFRHELLMWTGFWSLNSAYLVQEPLDLENIVMATTLSVLALFGLRRLFSRADPKRGATLIFAVLVLYPQAYYFSHLDPGYRHPIDPLLVVLASSSIVYILRGRLVRSRTKQQPQLAFQ